MGAVLAFIARLYAVEKQARQAGIVGDDLRLLRQQGAAPVLLDLHAYLLKIREEVLPSRQQSHRAVVARDRRGS